MFENLLSAHFKPANLLVVVSHLDGMTKMEEEEMMTALRAKLDHLMKGWMPSQLVALDLKSALKSIAALGLMPADYEKACRAHALTRRPAALHAAIVAAANWIVDCDGIRVCTISHNFSKASCVGVW